MVLKGEHWRHVSQLLVGGGKGRLKLRSLLGFCFSLLPTSVESQCSLLRDFLGCTVRSFTEMADESVDQRPSKKLKFSLREEDAESGVQTTAGDTGEAQSQKPEREEDEKPEGPKSPPRDKLYPPQNRDKESPEPSKHPGTPEPYGKNTLPAADNPSTPKVSKPWRGRDQVPEVCSLMGSLMGEGGLVIYIYAMVWPNRLGIYLQLPVS